MFKNIFIYGKMVVSKVFKGRAKRITVICVLIVLNSIPMLTRSLRAEISIAEVIGALELNKLSITDAEGDFIREYFMFSKDGNIIKKYGPHNVHIHFKDIDHIRYEYPNMDGIYHISCFDGMIRTEFSKDISANIEIDKSQARKNFEPEIGRYVSDLLKGYDISLASTKTQEGEFVILTGIPGISNFAEWSKVIVTIEPAKNFAINKIEYFLPNGKLLRTIDYRNYIRINNAFWYPGETTRLEFYATEDNVSPVKSKVMKYTVVKISVNIGLQDSIFSVDIPDGTPITDFSAGGISYIKGALPYHTR